MLLLLLPPLLLLLLMLGAEHLHVSYMRWLSMLSLNSSLSPLVLSSWSALAFLWHRSQLVEGQFRQHQLALQHSALQKTRHLNRTNDITESPFVLKLSPFICPLIGHRQWSFVTQVFVIRQNQLGLCTEHCSLPHHNAHCQRWWLPSLTSSSSLMWNQS